MNAIAKGSAMSVFAAAVCVLAASTAISAEQSSTVRMETIKIDKKVVRQPAGSFRMPSHSLTVRVNGDSGLGGRKITVKARKGGASRTQTATLNNNGDATVVFQLGSVPTVAQGDYHVTVEKGPLGVPDNYVSTANYCFDRTDPVFRNVTVDSGHRNVSANFAIIASIAWNRQGYCW